MREDAVGATLTISSPSGPVWQATTTGGAPGRDVGHRLQNVAVDGTTYPIQHDVRGRISTAPDLDLTYDVYNRLVGAQKGTQWEAYLYDGDGLMVGRHTTSGDFEHYTWDGNQLVGAYGLSGAPKWEAVFGAGQDELLAYYDYITGTDVLPVRDWRNNVVAAYDAGTEALSGHAEYSPEGRLTTFDVAGNLVCQEEGTGSVCAVPGNLPFAFNGQWRSPLTGLSYMRNRWYSPRLGQFVSHDPLHYVDSTNLYAFAGFDPVNSWDPMGLAASDLAETKIEPAFKPERPAENTTKAARKKQRSKKIPDSEMQDPQSVVALEDPLTPTAKLRDRRTTMRNDPNLRLRYYEWSGRLMIGAKTQSRAAAFFRLLAGTPPYFGPAAIPPSTDEMNQTRHLINMFIEDAILTTLASGTKPEKAEILGLAWALAQERRQNLNVLDTLPLVAAEHYLFVRYLGLPTIINIPATIAYDQGKEVFGNGLAVTKRPTSPGMAWVAGWALAGGDE